jgi:hypothetical protein
MQSQLVSRKDSVDKNLEQGTWKRGVEPAWVSKAKDLPDFLQTPNVRKQWADVIREMIRQELPDFHTRPEWENQRRSCKASNKLAGKSPSKGDFQNAIFDDIIPALKTIASADIK